MAETNLVCCTPKGSYHVRRSTFSAAWGEDYADEWESVYEGRASNYWNGSIFIIDRGLVSFDLSSLPSPSYISKAVIKVPQLFLRGSKINFWGVFVDGMGVYGQSNAFGILRTRVTSLGQYYVSGWQWPLYDGEIELNSAGREFLDGYAGVGVATLGIRTSCDIAADSPDPPLPTDDRWFWLSDDAFPPDYVTLQLIYSSSPVYGGYIWVEGTNLAYLDDYRAKWLKEGTLTGTTGKIAGHLHVEGDYLHYIDSSGAERRILGTASGLTGKIPSQISINTKSPMLGTNLCYIDSSGNERCFEGT